MIDKNPRQGEFALAEDLSPTLRESCRGNRAGLFDCEAG